MFALYSVSGIFSYVTHKPVFTQSEHAYLFDYLRSQVQQESCTSSSEVYTLTVWMCKCIHAEQDAGNRLSSGLSIEKPLTAEISGDIPSGDEIC